MSSYGKNRSGGRKSFNYHFVCSNNAPSFVDQAGNLQWSNRSRSLHPKIRGCSDNNGWSAEEKLNHLTCALTEPANQLLWEFESATVHTCEDLIKRLRARYGGSDQTALYQTQLNTRRQKDGEEIGSLVQDIRRLMILAY